MQTILTYVKFFMEFWLLNIIAVLILCIVCAGIIIPQILLISFRKKLFDMPNERKIHTSAVPRLGGLAFMPVIFFSSMLCFGVDMHFRPNFIFESILPQANTLAFLSCALLMLYIVGMADDLIGIKYRAKFVVQILCAAFMIAGGVWIDNWAGILGIEEISPWFGWPYTIIVAVFITNAINLIDGVDGLASGLSSIAFLTYGIAYYLIGEYVYSLLAFGVLGVLVPFFYYNVFGDAAKQTKIFMGDTGSLTIGMIIAFLSIHMLQQPESASLNNANMAAVAFVPLIIPCFDVLRVYGERIINHKNPFLPDKRHIHHKLMELGMSTRRVMTVIVLISLIITLVNIYLSMYINITILLFGNMILWAIFMVMLNKVIHKHKVQAQSK